MAEVEDSEEQAESDRWLLRTLYAVSIAATVASAWLLLKDDPTFQIWLARVRAWWKHKTEDCEGCRRRREAVNRMLYEAMQIVSHGTQAEPE